MTICDDTIRDDTCNVWPARAWDKTPLDDGDSWGAFIAYRDQEPSSRSVKTAAKLSGCDLRHCYRWAEAHYWKRRVDEYDRWRDRELCRLNLADRRAMAKRHLDLSMGLLEAAALEAKRLLTELRNPEARRRLKVQEIVELTKCAINYERLTRGAVTENIGVKDLSKLSKEELDALKRLTAKVSEG